MDCGVSAAKDAMGKVSDDRPRRPPLFNATLVSPKLPSGHLTLTELQWPLRRAPVPAPTDMLHSSAPKAFGARIG